jgi:hypothetical protein
MEFLKHNLTWTAPITNLLKYKKPMFLVIVKVNKHAQSTARHIISKSFLFILPINSIVNIDPKYGIN